MKQTQRFFSLFLVACLLSALLVPAPVRADADASDIALPPPIPTEGDIWDGTTITAPSMLTSVDGVNYFKITTCAELAYVAQNGGDWLERNYILANNLIFNNVTLEWDSGANLTNDVETLHQWTPIGDTNHQFTGQFDGGGYTISGIYIEKESADTGLFSCIASPGAVKRVIMVNSYIHCAANIMYCYAGGIAGETRGNIEDCVFSGLVIGGSNHVGGIVGSSQTSDIKGCINYGAVIGGKSYVGGIAGYTFALNFCSISSCVNFGQVIGLQSLVGGIAGSSMYPIKNSANYGEVTGVGEKVGGIAGTSTTIENSMNCGTVMGSSDQVGGIAGSSSSSILCCVNSGAVEGEGENTGGITGVGKAVQNSYNTADVSGGGTVGGIAGSSPENSDLSLTNCFNVGNVTCTGDGIPGAVTGSSGVVWGSDTVTGCYYLKTSSVNAGLYGCGGFSSMDNEPEGFTACGEAELKQQATYDGWDFLDVWRISPYYNGGYPYLAWEPVEFIPPLEEIILNTDFLYLVIGDTVNLTAVPYPENAELTALQWSSEDSSVATVDQNGHVTAVNTGSTLITAACGEISATVNVTVTKPMEYRVEGITLRDKDGAALSAIPNGECLVTVSLTKQVPAGDAVVLLAAYGENGQFRGLMYVSVSGQSQGATLHVTLPVDNSDGAITSFRAFPVASFSTLQPLGEAAEFPAV